jgi:hypothetical protein|uniref:Uncharacterized protein n=1 Tax=Picea glauca TaxID=3330 RepID=A0A101LYF5_PICGL|nr:hypothetical protein ABT39_MTgene5822 [Picea glauca]QHR92305.1 hypothetical protein Q903MT_gene6347 [Picea sitchensis]
MCSAHSTIIGCWLRVLRRPNLKVMTSLIDSFSSQKVIGVMKSFQYNHGMLGDAATGSRFIREENEDSHPD